MGRREYNFYNVIRDVLHVLKYITDNIEARVRYSIKVVSDMGILIGVHFL